MCGAREGGLLVNSLLFFNKSAGVTGTKEYNTQRVIRLSFLFTSQNIQVLLAILKRYQSSDETMANLQCSGVSLAFLIKPYITEVKSVPLGIRTGV